MDVRPAPRVTIEGGPGWQLDDASPDLIGTDGGRRTGRRPPRALILTGAVAALLAFAAATVLAERRHDRPGEVAAATLSVSAWSMGDYGNEQPVSVKDGKAGLRIPFELANTGPRPIALLSVRIAGADIATEDLAGRQLAPGGRVRLSLVRPLDCAKEQQQIVPDGAVTRLVVQARTAAGAQEVEVLAGLSTDLLSRNVAIAMCGDLPPEEALISDLIGRSAVADGRTVLSLQITNASRHRLVVERVRASAPWLSARLVDEGGRPVQLPEVLPPGDFSTPRQPWQGDQGRSWRVEISLPDCRRIPEPLLFDYEQQLIVADLDSDSRSGSAGLGGDGHDVMLELVRLGCPS